MFKEVRMGRRCKPVKHKGADNTLAGGGEMGRLMRKHDWAATPLGLIEQWPQSLRTAVSICLASRFPIIIFWGKELRQFYNDAYRPMLGITKHPYALGQRAEECWPEIWDEIGRIAADMLAADSDDLPFTLLYLFAAEGKSAHLAATTGIASETLATPMTLALDDPEAAWPLAQVTETGLVAQIDELAARFG